MNGRVLERPSKWTLESLGVCLLHEPAPPLREVKRTDYVGIDVGEKRCAVCVTDEDGDVLRELTYSNTRRG